MNELRVLGRPASPGFAQGTLFVLGTAPAKTRSAGEPAKEAAALQQAIAGAAAALRELAASATDAAAEIVAFQVAMLEDNVLSAPAFDSIAQGRPAHLAWRAALDAEIVGYLESSDLYFRGRATDLQDIRDRVLDLLMGADPEEPVPNGALVVAEDLPPSRFLGIDWARGGAIALTAGSSNSHVAMLARSRGVPMVVNVDRTLAELRPRASEHALLDADRGELIVAPSPRARAEFARASDEFARELEAGRRLLPAPAYTADGTRIRVLLNIADPSELDALDPSICDGIGLVRTEFLFERSGGLPDEDSQYLAYRRIAEWAQGRPVTIRTLDAGGDKPIAGLTIDGEGNPFLGVRGLRLSLARPEVFRAQLRALARAAVHGQVKVMLPMVTLPRELEAARAMLNEELQRLQAAGVRCARPRLGIMIEVPAAAIAAETFDADFLSIGSNDLAQYVAAAGRDNPAVADLASPTQLAMLRLVRDVARVGQAREIEVSLCGDAGGDPRAIPALLGAGLRSLSMAPAAIGRAKLAIAGVRLAPQAGPEARPHNG